MTKYERMRSIPNSFNFRDWNKWVEIVCVVEWKWYTKLKVFPLSDICLAGRKFLAFFIENNFKPENPVKQRYTNQICLSVCVRVSVSVFFFSSLNFSMVGLSHSQIFYFWTAKASEQARKIQTTKSYVYIQIDRGQNQNPSNRLKAIMSNRNVNNPIKISSFSLPLSLSMYFLKSLCSGRHTKSQKMYLLYSKANKTFTRCKFCVCVCICVCTKAIDDIIIIFFLLLSLNIFLCMCVCVLVMVMLMQIFFFSGRKEEQPID